MIYTATNDVTALCANHLREEEHLLTAALPIVRSVQDVFTRREPIALPELVQKHREIKQRIDDMQQRRQVLREQIAGRCKLAVQEVRLSRVLELLPTDARETLRVQLASLRRMADELTAANHRLSIHLRIYLDAYQSLLRDLTGTTSGSGRYGPRGNTEAPAYRPLIQVHG
jgi:hypothetical protein